MWIEWYIRLGLRKCPEKSDLRSTSLMQLLWPCLCPWLLSPRRTLQFVFLPHQTWRFCCSDIQPQFETPLPPRKKSLDFTITCRKAWGVHAKDYLYIDEMSGSLRTIGILMLHPRVRVLSCMTYSLCWITYITDSCETIRLSKIDFWWQLEPSREPLELSHCHIITTVGWCHRSRFHLRVQTFGTEPCCLLADDQVKYLNPDAFAVINGRLQARSAFQNPSMIQMAHLFIGGRPEGIWIEPTSVKDVKTEESVLTILSILGQQTIYVFTENQVTDKPCAQHCFISPSNINSGGHTFFSVIH